MDDQQWLATRFEADRPHLRAVAYRMLGSLTEADDAVQEAWLRLSRSDADEIRDLTAWLTTVVARVCLNLLRGRRTRREDSLEARLPEPVITLADRLGPEQEALLAESVGLAMLIVLDTLTPAERLAFVLHDTFGIPFDQIGTIVGRTPTAARQLASRARRRVRAASPPMDADPGRQRTVVDAFLAAARAGDFEALLAVLDPDVVVRGDFGARRLGLQGVRGREAVARQALAFTRLAPASRHALVNGLPGLVVAPNGRVFAVLGFTVAADRIVEIAVFADPARLESTAVNDG